MSEPLRKQSAPADAHESGDSDDLASEMGIDVKFEGRNPESSDFQYIKELLQQLFLKASVNLSEMSSALINQTKIGSVIKQIYEEGYTNRLDDDDDDYDVNQVFGITSILNITKKTSDCVKNLQKLMLDMSNLYSDSNTTQFVNKLLSDDKSQVGLLINERFVNIPPPISVPLFQATRKELFCLKTKNPSYNFDYLIMICKLYKMKKDKGNKTFEDLQIIWSNAEEEFFDEAADYKFEFCVQNDMGSGLAGNWVESYPKMIPFRRVLIFPMDKFYSIINHLESLMAPGGTNYCSAYHPVYRPEN